VGAREFSIVNLHGRLAGPRLAAMLDLRSARRILRSYRHCTGCFSFCEPLSMSELQRSEVMWRLFRSAARLKTHDAKTAERRRKESRECSLKR